MVPRKTVPSILAYYLLCTSKLGSTELETQPGPRAREPDRRGGGGAPRALDRLVAPSAGVDGDDGHAVPAQGDVRHGPAGDDKVVQADIPVLR